MLLQLRDVLCCVVEIVRAFTYVINQSWAMYWGTSRWSTLEIMANTLQFLLFHNLIINIYCLPVNYTLQIFAINVTFYSSTAVRHRRH